ncbi:hypothetical protein pETSU_110 [Edwardsiella phage pEt-SU]|uniref:Uncharacterized protein n=1 Tax=Edwardsiella phage pEt-SU TaxID=2562142 RepID=A0A4D6DWG0_9CAUD|nr:hypothetical protein HOV39_gp110 [Edwardsiella phage pEt-SU]QBZ70691.1 hypothetical protein pETSU_110 [Edwardsiella phage pEt-SU]
MAKFYGKNGDWAIPIAAILIFGMFWGAKIATGDKKLTENSKIFLETYGYEEIVVNPKAIGCRFDDVMSFDDRGRAFTAVMPSGKKIGGVVCTAKNDVSVLNVNYQEQ